MTSARKRAALRRTNSRNAPQQQQKDKYDSGLNGCVIRISASISEGAITPRNKTPGAVAKILQLFFPFPDALSFGTRSGKGNVHPLMVTSTNVAGRANDRQRGS